MTVVDGSFEQEDMKAVTNVLSMVIPRGVSRSILIVFYMAISTAGIDSSDKGLNHGFG